jgi:acetylornithine aminotransferase
MGALALTGQPAKADPFRPLPGEVEHIEFGDVAALDAAVSDRTAMVILEPIQGENGVVVPPAGYLAAAREICTRNGALLVLDEVQTGVGRTGHWFHHQSEGVEPDVITLAKGLGGGLPIGACIGLGEAGDLFAPGDHGSTFGGNPIACAAALAVLTTIDDDGLLAHVKRVGEHLADGLANLDSPLVTGVRGSGLWRGVTLSGDHAGAIETAARDNGLLVNAVKPDVIRLAPPLIVSDDEVDEAVAALASALRSTEQKVGP